MEVTLDALKKHSPQPPTVPIPPASPVVTNRRQPSVSVRIESEESKRAREESARKEQEKKDEEERAKKDAIEKKKREAEEEAKRIEEEEAARKRKVEEDRIRMEEEEKERIRQAEEAETERLRQEEEDRLEAEQQEAEQQEAEQARIALEEEEQKQQDALEAEEAQLEAEEAADIVQTSSPTSESQEPEDGEVSEHDEAPVPQLNGDSGKKLKESLRIDTTAMPPPTEIPRRRPGPLDLASTTKKDISAPPPSALLTARVIENLSEVAYPEGIKSPKVELNANVRDGRFRCVLLLSLRMSHSLLRVDMTVTSLCNSCIFARRSRLPFLLSTSLALNLSIKLRFPWPAVALDVIVTPLGRCPFLPTARLL